MNKGIVSDGSMLCNYSISILFLHKFDSAISNCQQLTILQFFACTVNPPISLMRAHIFSKIFGRDL